jgi:hypothetical protein
MGIVFVFSRYWRIRRNHAETGSTGSMLEFLIGLIVGGSIGIVGHYLGYTAATRFWTNAIDVIKRDKTKLEADLSIANNRIQDLINGK